MTLDRRTSFLVGIGGVVGAGARWWSFEAVVTAGSFPWTTLSINVVGAFLLGVVARRSPSTAALVGVGFCGGLTTFSTFSVELATLLDDGAVAIAVSYLAASLAAGVGAYRLGAIVGARG